MMKKFALVAFALILFASLQVAETQASSIQGVWHITAVLTATSVPNAYVKEGHMKEETWQIQQNGDSATLTTPNGSIGGRYLPQTPEFPGGVWRFELMAPNFMGQPNLGAKFEVVIVPRSANVLSGGSTVTYLGTNFSGEWFPVGLESWRFDANRLQ